MSDTSHLELPPEIHFFERGWLSSNNVLLIDDQQSVLIDSGYWSHAPQTCDLVAHQLGSRPLDRLLNTHLHSDHCGGNALLQEKYPTVRTYAPPGLASHVHLWNPVALSYQPTGQHCPSFKLDGVLNHGDTFLIAQKQWEIHAAPGHDPHSIVLHCPQEGILISADALWSNGFGVVFPELAGESGFQEVSDTLDLIEKLRPKVILPGHGSAFNDVPLALDRARRKLAGFQADPQLHAKYAAKVLVKFKLLEFKQVQRDAFLQWASNTPLLASLHRLCASADNFQTWFNEICHALARSQACRQEGTMWVNL